MVRDDDPAGRGVVAGRPGLERAGDRDGTRGPRLAARERKRARTEGLKRPSGERPALGKDHERLPLSQDAQRRRTAGCRAPLSDREGAGPSH